MKSMKNHHPVTDALGRLDDEAVLACMSEDVTPRATLSHRALYRRLALAAACLTLTAAVGLAALLPLMRTDTPSLPETSHADTAIENGEEEKYPFVNVQLLSYDASAEDNEDVSSQPTVDVENPSGQLTSYRNHLVRHFDCDQGETVSIISHAPENPREIQLSETLLELQAVEGESSRETQMLMIKIERILNRIQHGQQRLNNVVAVDDTTYMWCIPTAKPSYDVVEFLIRNEKEEIVGAGSICIGIRYHHYVNQLRTAILDSTRFDTPVSEEEATAYLESLRATAEEAYASMDFSPLNDGEGFALSRSAVRDIEKADPNMVEPAQMNSCTYGFGDCLFKWYTFGVEDSPETTRRFFMFGDGTYAEVAPEGAEAYDGMLEQLFGAWGSNSDKADFYDLIIPLTDGRVITFHEESVTEPLYGKYTEDGEEIPSITRNKWVAVIMESFGETV